MPCRYEETPEEIAAAAKLAKEKTVGPLKKRIAALEKERDRLTNWLCAACHNLDAIYKGRVIVDVFDENQPLRLWWVEHKRKDIERRAKELDAKMASKTLPLKLERIDDGELFTLNADGMTYSIEASKQQFPNALHNEYTLAALVNCGGFRIIP